MPDLKDKYSDSELDRSNKAFEEIVEPPYTQTPPSDDGAGARSIENQEKNPTTPRNGADGSAASVVNAENPYNYQKQAPEKKGGRGFSFGKKKKATAFVGGGVIGIVLAIATISPFGVFIHLKEVASAWADRFNDTGYHIRMKSVYKARYFNNKTCLAIP